MVSTGEKRDDDMLAARLVMSELSNMVAIPMSIVALLRLNVPLAMYQSGQNSPLTADEILSLLNPPPPPTASASNLQRLLRLLTTHGVFREHPDDRFTLTEVGKTLIPERPGEASYADYILQHNQEALFPCWQVLHESVLRPEEDQFARVNGGVPAYEYYGMHPELNELMQRAMWGWSKPCMEEFVDEYCGSGGFDGVETLVDVGGSSGACLRMIMDRCPGVGVGINFDLPSVVAGAPTFPGVTHIGGDALESIPRGDALFFKGLSMTFGDDAVVTLLRNCHKALPDAGGKVVVLETVRPEETDCSRGTRSLLEMDVYLMAMYGGSKSKMRTAEEYRKLGALAGFTSFRKLMLLDNACTVMEFRK